MSTLPSDADFRHEVAGPLLYKYHLRDMIIMARTLYWLRFT